MESITPQTGIMTNFGHWLFGERAARLTERLQRVHWLSYLLVFIVSLTTVLVFGKVEVRMIFAPGLVERVQGVAFTLILVGAVFAADLAALESLVRIPVLARNRQHADTREHVAYVALVILTESATYGGALVAAERNPEALNPTNDLPILPTHGPVFYAVIGLRVVQLAWTIVQLVIIRGKLPVLLSTLTNTGKEIVGAHVERQFAGLDIKDLTLLDTFPLYSAMARPPRRVPTWWNGWLVKRELAAEAEEQRQVDNVVDALEELERRRQQRATVAFAPSERDPLDEHLRALEARAAQLEREGKAPAWAMERRREFDAMGLHDAPVTVEASPALPQPQYAPDEAFAIDWDDPTLPPTGPGSPAAARPVRTPRKERPAVLRLAVPPETRETAAQARSSRANTRRVRTGAHTATVEAKVRAAWHPGMSVTELERAAGISRNAAGKWRKVLLAEAAQRDTDDVAQVAQ